jgi:pyruvate/2-oxoglutarate dehydrogenase complex dihydrolipoamide acyltransferase (E2) component
LQERRTEELTPTRAERELAEKGITKKNTTDMVRVVEEADLSKLPDDATSLATWLGRARAVLPPLVEKLFKES